MTHCDRVLALLADGRPHVHMELYRLGVIAHSRVADLRRRGYTIACWTMVDRGARVSVYQLVSSPVLEGVGVPPGGSMSTPASSSVGAVAASPDAQLSLVVAA